MESSGTRRQRGARARARARRRRRKLVHTTLVVAAIVGVSAAGTVYVKARAHSDDRRSAASASAGPSASEQETDDDSVEPVTEPAVDRDALVGKAMKSVGVPSGAHVSVAVLDLRSGESAAHGEAAFDTASIVKVDILAALLLQAQDAGRRLTANERACATKMIENSDNDTATTLWNAIGGKSGLDAANKRFGLTATSGGEGPLWGLTQTTATDQLILLRQVFGDGDSKLSEASRAYLQELMRGVEPDQRWGVTAAGDGSGWALKNGWLERSSTSTWDVNSIGRVSVDGTQYLVAVLSEGTAAKEDGIALIEAAVKAAMTAFTGTGASASASADPTTTG